MYSSSVFFINNRICSMLQLLVDNRNVNVNHNVRKHCVCLRMLLRLTLRPLIVRFRAFLYFAFFFVRNDQTFRPTPGTLWSFRCLTCVIIPALFSLCFLSKAALDFLRNPSFNALKKLGPNPASSLRTAAEVK
jgi:hypothetical protein